MSPEKTNDLIRFIVKKALAGGWQIPFEEPIKNIVVSADDVDGTYQTEPYIRFELDGEHDWCVGIPHIIFDIEFVKALWPGFVDLATHKIYETPPPGIPVAACWKVNVQMMVVSTERLRFLAKATGYETH